LENKPASRDQTGFQPRTQILEELQFHRLGKETRETKGINKYNLLSKKNYENEDFDQIIEDHMHCCDDT
jgi:hypothetical protein